jgi:NDP-sugar pyrophosphorylase family protein
VSKPPVVVLRGGRGTRLREKTETLATGYLGKPLERLAAAGELRAHRHESFWDCMDTYKDAVVFDELWRGGEAPWRVWDGAPRAHA